jgi:hypothetical protein
MSGALEHWAGGKAPRAAPARERARRRLGGYGLAGVRKKVQKDYGKGRCHEPDPQNPGLARFQEAPSL